MAIVMVDPSFAMVARVLFSRSTTLGNVWGLTVRTQLSASAL
jgi:hypothetical protein